MKHDLLAHGASAALTDWLLARRDRFTDRRRSLRWQLRYQSFWFERLLRMQERAGPAPPAEPLFVLGFWRSGTTLLHNLLVAETRCRAPLTWECFSPASMTLQAAPRTDVVAERPMDGGLVHLLGPQEDEFAALLLGEPSLYRGFLDPGALEVLGESLDPFRSERLERWRRFVAQVGAEGSDPVLLKSPNHVFRLATLRHWYPGMRSVWIGRAFGDVLRSNIAMWTAMVRRHAFTSFDPAILVPFLAGVANAYARVLERLLDEPSADILWVNYDRVTRDPITTTMSVARFLGLAPRPTGARPTTVDATVRQSSRHQGNALPAVLQRATDRIDRLHHHAESRFG